MQQVQDNDHRAVVGEDHPFSMNVKDDFYEDSGLTIGRKALENVAGDIEKFKFVLNVYKV